MTLRRKPECQATEMTKRPIAAEAKVEAKAALVAAKVEDRKALGVVRAEVVAKAVKVEVAEVKVEARGAPGEVKEAATASIPLTLKLIFKEGSGSLPKPSFL
jgi:hypothetical protein